MIGESCWSIHWVLSENLYFTSLWVDFMWDKEWISITMLRVSLLFDFKIFLPLLFNKVLNTVANLSSVCQHTSNLQKITALSQLKLSNWSFVSHCGSFFLNSNGTSLFYSIQNLFYFINIALKLNWRNFIQNFPLYFHVIESDILTKFRKEVKFDKKWNS